MADINSILTEAIKALTLGVVTVILKVGIQYGSAIAYQVFKYLEAKAMDKNNAYVCSIARSVWDRVEEDYRINDKIISTFNNKAEYFDKLLLDKFPTLSQQDLDELRQTVAGEVNRYKNDWLKCDTSAEKTNEDIPKIEPVTTNEEVK